MISQGGRIIKTSGHSRFSGTLQTGGQARIKLTAMASSRNRCQRCRGGRASMMARVCVCTHLCSCSMRVRVCCLGRGFRLSFCTSAHAQSAFFLTAMACEGSAGRSWNKRRSSSSSSSSCSSSSCSSSSYRLCSASSKLPRSSSSKLQEHLRRPWRPVQRNVSSSGRDSWRRP